jgi:hypothetical protein
MESGDSETIFCTPFWLSQKLNGETGNGLLASLSCRKVTVNSHTANQPLKTRADCKSKQREMLTPNHEGACTTQEAAENDPLGGKEGSRATEHGWSLASLPYSHQTGWGQRRG